MVESREPVGLGDGWRKAVLPNPFDASADQRPLSEEVLPPSSLPANLVQPEAECTNVDSAQSPLALLRGLVPDFAGQLPRPLPMLGEYDSLPPFASATGNEHVDFSRASAVRDVTNLRGIGLIGAVFDVLSKELGAEYSTAQLMLAAQQLIDLSKADYVGVHHKEGGGNAGYYSWNLVRAFSAHAWQITEVETHSMDHCDTAEFSPEAFENAKFIIEGRGERTWDF